MRTWGYFQRRKRYGIAARLERWMRAQGRRVLHYVAPNPVAVATQAAFVLVVLWLAGVMR